LQCSSKSHGSFFQLSTLLETEAQLCKALERICRILCSFLKVLGCLPEESDILERRASLVGFLPVWCLRRGCGLERLQWCLLHGSPLFIRRGGLNWDRMTLLTQGRRVDFVHMCVSCGNESKWQ